MGRRRVEIKRIEDKARRQTTFTKRRDGLFKKTGELCNLCGTEAAVITFSNAGNTFAFGNPSVDYVLDRYLSMTSSSSRASVDGGEVAAAERVREREERLAEALARLEVEKKRGEAIDEALSMLKLNEDVVGDSKVRASEEMGEIRSAEEMAQLEAEKKHDEVVDEMLTMLNAKAEASRLKEVEQGVGMDVDEETTELQIGNKSQREVETGEVSNSGLKVHEVSIVKVVWVPPEYGDGVACICADGTLSLWEEVAEDTKPLQWKLCKDFETSSNQVLDMQFGVSFTSLKLVAAYSNGHVKVYELLDPLELKNWQLQAEFQNVIDSVSKFGKAACLSASISWTPQRGESQQLSFVLGFNSNVMQLNSAKVWEFDQDHQRWLPVAELALPEDKGDPVYVVAWAPNIGRPYEVIAVATHKGITIWHLGLNPGLDGRLSVGKVALLSGHVGEVWQMEWDMSGMTLATTGSEGAVRLWQSNLNGIWHEQAAFEPTT
ncbi:unnamed protein product [Camellia sinensis]